jgi:4'-phosphopantetheinyl transferase
MSDNPPPVRRWPSSFAPEQELLIVAVDTPDSPIRDTARQLVRSVLLEILGDVELIAISGQPIRLARTDSPLGISVSHESGLSLLAIHRSGPVGIDVLNIPENPDWLAEIPTLASDYLSPQVARRIARLPAREQAAQFARDWTTQEARLKCLGLGLEEWSAVLEKNLSQCRVQELDLPAGYVGAVAIPKSA